MNLKRFKHALLRLTLEEKVMGIGAITVLIASFLPWFQQTNIFDESTVILNGLAGDLGIIGFVIFLMSLMGLLFLIAEQLHIRLPQFGYSKEKIIFFLMGQCAFINLIAIAVYLKRSLDFTEAGLRYGIGITFVGTLFAAFAAFSLIKKNEKKDPKAYFGQDDPLHSDEPDTTSEEDFSDNDVEPNHRPNEEEHQTLERGPSGELQEEIAEDEEDVHIAQGLSPESVDSRSVKIETPYKSKYSDQGSYFNREAGL